MGGAAGKLLVEFAVAVMLAADLFCADTGEVIARTIIKPVKIQCLVLFGFFISFFGAPQPVWNRTTSHIG